MTPRELFRDLLGALGAGLIGFGLWSIHPGVLMVVAGAGLFTVAFVVMRRRT